MVLGCWFFVLGHLSASCPEALVGKERSLRQRRVRKYRKTLEEIKGPKKR